MFGFTHLSYHMKGNRDIHMLKYKHGTGTLRNVKVRLHPLVLVLL